MDPSINERRQAEQDRRQAMERPVVAFAKLCDDDSGKALYSQEETDIKDCLMAIYEIKSQLAAYRVSDENISQFVDNLQQKGTAYLQAPRLSSGLFGAG